MTQITINTLQMHKSQDTHQRERSRFKENKKKGRIKVAYLRSKADRGRLPNWWWAYHKSDRGEVRWRQCAGGGKRHSGGRHSNSNGNGKGGGWAVGGSAGEFMPSAIIAGEDGGQITEQA